MRKPSMRSGGVVALVLLFAAVGGLSAQQDKSHGTAPTVAGKWDMAVPSDQGTMAASFVIDLDGSKVTGTFTSDHTGDVPLAGKFEDGTLTFSITVHTGSDAMQLDFIGKLKGDGTLGGTLSGPMGELAWTASRAK